MSQPVSCEALAMALAELFVERLHPARSKLASGGAPAEDLAVVFNNAPFFHIVVRGNALLDVSGDLIMPPLIGIVLHICFQSA